MLTDGDEVAGSYRRVSRHAGASKQERLLLRDRDLLVESTALSPAGRQAIEVAMAMIDTLGDQAQRIREECQRRPKIDPLSSVES